MSKKNFTITTVATAPSPATSGTSLVVATGTGSLFALNEPAIIFPTNNQPLVSNAEIVMVTNISSDTLTITRGQEGTSARAIVAGDIIIQGITAKDWNDLVASKFTWKGAWATTTAYAVNDTVEYGGSGYICIVAHTSGTFATDLSAGKWEMFVEGVSADSIASTIHGATAKTTPVDADEVGLIDSAASNVLKKLTWSNIKATLKSYFDSVTTTLTNKTLSSPLFTGTIDGWIDAGETWTYASADDPTYTFTISGDKTSKYSVGMKIKLTQTTVKYFIITAISYSSPNTTVTVYGGTDYDLANATISANYYSMVKSPQGFPMSPAKWSVTTTITSNVSQTSVANGATVYITGLTISVPIGVWDIRFTTYNLGMESLSVTASPIYQIALSTSNYSIANAVFRALRQFNITTSSGTQQLYFGENLYGRAEYASKTALYVVVNNIRGSGTASNNTINLEANASAPSVLRATCAYL